MVDGLICKHCGRSWPPSWPVRFATHEASCGRQAGVVQSESLDRLGPREQAAFDEAQALMEAHDAEPPREFSACEYCHGPCLTVLSCGRRRRAEAQRAYLRPTG